MNKQSFVLVKDKKKVCRERAKLVVEEEFAPLLEAQREKWKQTKNPKHYQALVMLNRKKLRKEEEYYEKFLDNFFMSKDSYSGYEGAPEGLSAFNEFLIEQLKNI
jgi:hypothetical protein